MGSSRGPQEDKLFLDRLTSVDNFVNDAVGILKDIREDISQIDPEIQTENVTVRDGVPRTSYQLEMSSNVPASSSTIKTREVQFDGWVTAYTVGFPDGADQAVGIRLEDNQTGDQFFPRNPEDEYFAANDFTYPFNLTFPVEQGQELATVLLNNDPNNNHFINSMVTVTEKGEGENVAEFR